MKLSELVEKIQRINSVSLASYTPDPEVVIKVVRVGSVGQTPAVELTNIFHGIDWDSGRVILTAGAELREIDRDEISALRDKYDELGWTQYKVGKIKKENEKLKNELSKLKEAYDALQRSGTE